MRRPPYREGALDGIWSSADLLHVPRAEVPATLRGWRRCLAAGGVLGLSTAIGDHEGWEWVEAGRAAPPRGEPRQDLASVPPGPLRRWFVYHRPDALLALVEDAGFAVVSTGQGATHRRWLQIAPGRGPDPGPARRRRDLRRRFRGRVWLPWTPLVAVDVDGCWATRSVQEWSTVGREQQIVRLVAPPARQDDRMGSWQVDEIRLDPVTAAVERAVAEERLVGATVRVVHRGAIVHRSTHGASDRAAGRPFEPG